MHFYSDHWVSFTKSPKTVDLPNFESRLRDESIFRILSQGYETSRFPEFRVKAPKWVDYPKIALTWNFQPITAVDMWHLLSCLLPPGSNHWRDENSQKADSTPLDHLSQNCHQIHRRRQTRKFESNSLRGNYHFGALCSIRSFGKWSFRPLATSTRSETWIVWSCSFWRS